MRELWITLVVSWLSCLGSFAEIFECKEQSESEFEFVINISHDTARVVKRNGVTNIGKPFALTELEKTHAYRRYAIGIREERLSIKKNLFNRTLESGALQDGDISLQKTKLKCESVEQVKLDVLSLYHLFVDDIADIHKSEIPLLRAANGCLMGVPAGMAVAALGCVCMTVIDAGWSLNAIISAFCNPHFQEIAKVAGSFGGILGGICNACYQCNQRDDKSIIALAFVVTAYNSADISGSKHNKFDLKDYLSDHDAKNVDTNKFIHFMRWLDTKANCFRKNKYNDLVVNFQLLWVEDG